jgi:hypothetical protein
MRTKSAMLLRSRWSAARPDEVVVDVSLEFLTSCMTRSRTLVSRRMVMPCYKDPQANHTRQPSSSSAEKKK